MRALRMPHISAAATCGGSHCSGLPLRIGNFAGIWSKPQLSKADPSASAQGTTATGTTRAKLRVSPRCPPGCPPGMSPWVPPRYPPGYPPTVHLGYPPGYPQGYPWGPPRVPPGGAIYPRYGRGFPVVSWGSPGVIGGVPWGDPRGVHWS